METKAHVHRLSTLLSKQPFGKTIVENISRVLVERFIGNTRVVRFFPDYQKDKLKIFHYFS
jgi:hypothetical protein